MFKIKLLRLLIKFRDMYRYRKTVRALHALTNRDLVDLGIRRSEIESVALRSICRRRR